jgi:hypothetical protein
MARSRSSLVSAAAVALGLAACNSSQQGYGRLSLRLTDAPGVDVRSAVVTISRISLHGTGGDWVLRDEPATVDLVDYVNTTFPLVDDASVAAGTYTELRMQITGGYLIVQDPDGAGTLVFASAGYLPAGAHVDGQLKMPSFAQSGLKVILPGDALVVKTESKILLVDFDVAQSFGHEAGNSASWVMHPVVKADDFLLSGNVVATLGRTPALAALDPLPLGSFTAVLTNAAGSAESLAFVPVGAGTCASATFRYLLPGTYTVAVHGPAAPPMFDVQPAGAVEAIVGSGAETFVPFWIASVH